MIIAASCDGILVSDKERSGYMKPYVEKIESEAMYAEKSWGTYTVVDVQKGSLTVKISMRSDEHMSYHMHMNRKEVWVIVSGIGQITINGKEKLVSPGDLITIDPLCKHTIKALSVLNLIEIQIGDEISVDDKIKCEMDYI